MNIVFLAAGKSSRIFKVLKKPKCLLNIKNKTIIQKLIDNFKNCNVKKINIVVGFKANLIKDHLKNHKKINYIFNKDYSKKEMLYSMVLALKKINDDIIFSYTDIIYKPSIAKSLSKKRKNIFLPVLCNWKKIWKIRKKNIFVDAEEIKINKKLELLSIGSKIQSLKHVKYQYMGLLFIPKSKRKKIIEIYDNTPGKEKMHLTKFLNIILKKSEKIQCIKYKNHWYEFDDINDYYNYIKNF